MVYRVILKIFPLKEVHVRGLLSPSKNLFSPSESLRNSKIYACSVGSPWEKCRYVLLQKNRFINLVVFWALSRYESMLVAFWAIEKTFFKTYVCHPHSPSDISFLNFFFDLWVLTKLFFKNPHLCPPESFRHFSLKNPRFWTTTSLENLHPPC